MKCCDSGSLFETSVVVNCLECVVTDYADIESKVMQDRKIVCEIRAIMNTNGWSWECVRLLHESVLIPLSLSTLVYGSETLVWKEKKKL